MDADVGAANRALSSITAERRQAPELPLLLQGRPLAEVGGGAMEIKREAVLSVQRDILPLPVGSAHNDVLMGRSAGLLSVGQRRKARRARLDEAWLCDGIRALNQIGGRGEAAREELPLSAVQRATLRRLARLYGMVGRRPDDFSPLRAFEALQGMGTGYTDDVLADGGGVVYRRGAISLPRVAGAVSLDAAVPRHLQS